MKYQNKYEAASHFNKGVCAALQHETYQGNEHDLMFMEGWRYAKFGSEMQAARNVALNKNGFDSMAKMVLSGNPDDGACWFCGTDEDPWFSRVEPMGYFCAGCGMAR